MKKLSLIFILIPSIISCRPEINRVSRPLLGTVVNLTIIAPSETASKAAQDVFNEIKRIESLMSPFKETSDIYKINNHAYKTSVSISEETYKLLMKSIAISKDSDGCFDITFASISHLWNYKNKNFMPPAAKSIEKYLPLVNYKNIKIDSEKKSVRFLKSGMRIGLGGIAKGYAVKRGVEVLIENGVAAGIVEEGGDLQVIGNKNGNMWRTGLIDPKDKSLLMAVELDDMDSIATSGNYERFVEYKGKKYHHIIDPHTGYPAETFSSVSVISKDPILSDSYATAIFIMGLDRAVEFLKRHKELSVILIDLKYNVYVSTGLKNRIKMLKRVDVKWI